MRAYRRNSDVYLSLDGVVLVHQSSPWSTGVKISCLFFVASMCSVSASYLCIFLFSANITRGYQFVDVVLCMLVL